MSPSQVAQRSSIQVFFSTIRVKMEESVKRRRGTFFIALFFVGLFSGVFLYKVLVVKYPVLSKSLENLWTFELKISFQGSDGEGTIRHFLPSNDRGQLVVREDFVSNKLYFVVGKEDGNTVIEWRGKQLKGEMQLFYRATVQTRPRKIRLSHRGVEDNYPPQAIQYLLMEPKMESIQVELQEFLGELVGEEENKLQQIRTIYEFLDEKVQTVSISRDPSLAGPIRTKRATIEAKNELFVYLSRLAGVPARAVHGIALEEGFRQQRLLAWTEVFLGGKWVPVDIESRLFGQLPESRLILYRGDRPFISSSVKRLEHSFTIKREHQSAFSLFYGTTARVGSVLHEWSLFSLPVETQQVFRVILLIPLGALIVSVFRNIIGINTFGTFMPVLIALAFRNTRLGWGLILFSVVIGLGLVSRWVMDRFKLLLVPRLAVIVTVLVILLIIGSLIGSHMEIYRILAVALFPMVIMTMTIERLSIILMERGRGEAIKVSLGTLVVSTCGYLVMSISSVQDFCFAFPEVLFALIGIQILLGRYTGYRLSEYFRFRSFLGNKDRG
jgi:hypothetical protein